MTESEKLKKAIAQRGLKVSFVADKLGITRQCLYKKINRKNDFTLTEIRWIIEILSLSESEVKDLFFANSVKYN